MLEQVEPESVGLSSERLQRVSSWLRDQVESERLAGCSVLVGRRGKIAMLEATGMADQAIFRPFTADTIVRIYSMTKSITTVAAGPVASDSVSSGLRMAIPAFIARAAMRTCGT